MKILLVHNTYQQRGGEDAVYEAELKLISQYGNTVDTILFDNSAINSVSKKIAIGLGTVYNFSSASLIEKKIKSFQPDIIHVHNFFPLVSPSVFFVAKKYHIPIVMTLHNYRLMCANALFFRNGKVCENCISKTFPLDGIIHKCYRNSSLQSAAVTLMSSIHKISGTWKNSISHYIALTEFSKNKFINSSLKIPEHKISVKPNFVSDFDESNYQRENYFLFVGRLSEEKGIRVLLDAFQNNGLPLKIIGDGPLKNSVQDATSTYSNIEYLGFQEKLTVLETMKKSRALIFPSLWYEGFPVTVCEALATGTPVIASDIGSLAEIIQDNWNGLLFSYKDANALDGKISYFNIHHAGKNEMYKNARQSYLENYTPEKNYLILEDIYSRLIKNAKKKGR